MDKSDECRRYKWSGLATNLLVSIWCHDLVQNQLKASSRNQPLWDSIARYMSRKGFPVTGSQCRTKIKTLLSSYNEAQKKNDPSSVDPYYDVIKKVSSNRNSTGRGTRVATLEQASQADDGDDNEVEVSLDSTLSEVKHRVGHSGTDVEHRMEFFDVGTQMPESQVLCSSEMVKKLESVVIKAIEAQTKAITNAIKMQSETIERLLTDQREKLGALVSSEKQSRTQLESRLNKLITKLEVIGLLKVAYVDTVVENSQQQS